jgi:DNA-binding beta-propeller fold protein YncE
VYVNVPGGVIGGGGTVVVVNTSSRAVEATWKLEAAGRNFPMAVSADGARIYVGCRRPARLLVLDTATGKTVASPECVGDADDIFCIGGLVLVSGGDGSVDVFTRGEGDRLERRTVSTSQGARTSMLSGDRLYVAARASGGNGAAILVYRIDGAGGR